MERLRNSTMLAICALTLLTIVCVTASTTTTEQNSTLNASSLTNYNCPKGCNCVMPTNARTKFLHTKCSAIDDLVGAEPIEPDFPIHSIDLSNLRLTRVGQTFSKLPNLTTINLSHNELHEFGHLGRRIKRLNLKYNRITSNKLYKLPPNLNTLNLQHNDISYLPREFMQLMQLTTLDLSHNEINCSCETLEVRNWLQERHVFMENPVICAYPAETHGKPWLQIKQSDICEKEKRGWNTFDDENELMFGDQPIETTSESDSDKEDIDKEFIPVNLKVETSTTIIESDVEGSGDIGVQNMEINSPLMLKSNTNSSQDNVEDDNDYASGDGSGGGFLDVSPSVNILKDENYNPGFVEAGHKDGIDDFSNPIVPIATDKTPTSGIFDKYNMGIYSDKAEDKPVTSSQPVTEDGIAPLQHHDLENVPVVTDGPTNGKIEEAKAIVHAGAGEKEDNKATYFLLGVIGLLVIGLLFFVGLKRCNQQGHFDTEAQRQTELLDMDKKNLGKPLQRNGAEHIPLIGEKSLVDQAKPMNGTGKKPYDSKDANDGADQQLMNGNGKNSSGVDQLENSTDPPSSESHPHEYHPITPRYPTPKSPRASKYAQYPLPANTENNNNTIHNDAYLPSSPKSGRYSPVYSPETGRVKIKLTETPRPKTPMLVTRSKSNAGDIITTPVHLSAAQHAQ